MVGCAAVFSAASPVGVARSPCVGVPSIPCVVSGGWWACAGVIRTASDSCFGGVFGACAPGGRAASAGGGAALLTPSWYALPTCGSWCPLWCPLSLRLGPCSFPLKVLPWVVEGAGGLGAGKTSGAGTRGVSLDVVIGGRTGYSDTNGGESSNN